MPGLGPRVGGAHVDVNMKMDEKSIAQVGKQIHRQLSSLSDRLNTIGEQNARVYRAIGRDAVVAWRSALAAAVTSAPLIGSAMSGIAGSATILGGALFSVGQSSAALIPIATSLGVAGLTASIGLNNFATAVGETNPKALNELLETMPKSMQNAVMATRRLSNEMRAAVWPVLFKGLTDGIDKLRDTGVIQRGLGLMAEQMNGLAKGVLRYANSAKGLKTINSFFENNAKVFGALSKAVVPFLDGFLRLTNALTPSALRFADGLREVGESFQSWTQGEGFAKRIDESMKKAQKTAGLFFDVLGNLGSAITNVFNAANPATNTFLQMLVDLTQRFEDWTSSVEGQTAIADWANSAVDVMEQFGRTAEAVFEVLAELANPRVIISFLKTLEGAFEYLGKLPLDKIVEGFVNISEALQPVSSLFLAIIIAGASLNIIIGSLLGQFGGLFSILFKFMQFKILKKILTDTGDGAKAAGAAAGRAADKGNLLTRAWDKVKDVFRRVKQALGEALGFFKKTGDSADDLAGKGSKLSGAFRPALSILGKFARFAGFAGIAVWFGTLIAKSEDLQGKFGELWDTAKDVGDAFKGAFDDIAKSLEPLAPYAEEASEHLGTLFGWLDDIATIAIGASLDAFNDAFKGVAPIVEGAGEAIAGFITTVRGLFNMDWSTIWDGLSQMGSGLENIFDGFLTIVGTFFSPAKWAQQALGAMRSFAGGIRDSIPTVLAAARGLMSAIPTLLARLPGRLQTLGQQAIAKLGIAIAKGRTKVVSAARNIFNGVVNFFQRLPGRLQQLGQQAVAKLGIAVVKGRSKVVSAAARIFSGVITALIRLPGRLQDLGQQAVVKLAVAIAKGISKAKSAAARIFTNVVTALVKLPGKLQDIASNAIGDLVSALGKGPSRAKGIADNIGNGILDSLRGLPGALASIGSNMITSLAGGMISSLASVAGAAARAAQAIRDKFPGSPVKDGPLTAWNYGSGATGGGRGLVDSIAQGLRDISPINKAMNDIASSIGMGVGSPTARAGAGAGGRAGNARPAQFPSRITLRIGDRDFVAYVSGIADDRIDAADNLTWQGA
jgi:hypothetical protein